MFIEEQATRLSQELNKICEVRYKQDVGVEDELLKKTFQIGFLEGAKAALELKVV